MRIHLLSRAAAALTIGTMLATASPAFAEMMTMKVTLDAAQEVPPNDSAGKGTADVSFDTESKKLDWTLEYSGLTDEATAAHFHGPAAAEATAGPVVPIDGDLASPIEGSATLTEEQATQLQDGMWYFNVHTAAHPDGEIRGQVMAAAM